MSLTLMKGVMPHLKSNVLWKEEAVSTSPPLGTIAGSTQMDG